MSYSPSQALVEDNIAYEGSLVYVFEDVDFFMSDEENTIGVEHDFENRAQLGIASDPNDICVNIFRDYNSNGTDNGTGEPGIAGLTVTAYNVSNTASPFTDTGGGNYTFTPGNNDIYRIEVTGLPAGLEPSAAGSTTVFFTNRGNTIEVGLHRPDEYFPNNIFLATPCYVDGPISGNGSNFAGADVMVIVPEGDLTGGDGNVNPTEDGVATHSQIGATFGSQYSRSSNSIYAAAFTKRHTAFGPGGTGAIYRIDLAGDVPTPPVSSTSVTEFINLNTLFTSTTAGADPHPTGSNFNRDPVTYDAVG
ncbi:MAG: SdrD B-like domain-containing protein, partial [Cyanobacteria bacterium J06649_11]